jgi:hypothetical protein
MLRLSFLITLLSIVTLSVWSQETRVKKNPLKNFYVAPSAGVEILSLKNYADENNGFSVVYKGVPSLRAGLDVDYKVNDNFKVQSGIFYSAKNYDRTETNKEGTTAYLYDQQFKNRYVETLIGGAFNFVKGRFDVGIYSNLNVSFLISANETRLTETGNKFINDNKPGFNKMLGNFEPGITFNYNINYRLSFGLKTGARLYLNSISIDKKFTNNGVLVQSGLFYKF